MRQYRTSGFRTHLGYATLEFVAVDHARAEAFVRAYIEEHGIDAPGWSVIPI